MKHKLVLRLVILLYGAVILLGDTTFANETGPHALVPLPSVLDFTRGEGWGIALGTGVEYETAYDGSDEYEFEVEPAGAVQWRRGNHLFFWGAMEVGWRGLFQDSWLVQGGTRYEDGLEADDSEDGYLDGLPDRDSHIVGFGEVRRSLGLD